MARTFGLYGANDFETAQIDSFSEGLNDLRIEYSKASYWAKPEEKETLLAAFFETHLPKHLGLLEKNVVETPSVNLADVQFAASWETVSSSGKVGADTLNAYPKLKARFDLFHANEAIAKYLAGRKATPF